MMDPRVAALLERLQASKFQDLAGAEITLALPVGERLLNDAAAQWMPPSSPVRELQIHPQAGNRIAVRARIGTSPFMPALNVTLVVEKQPEWPASPVLVFRLEMGGLMALAGPAIRFLDALPPGVRLENDRLFVDLARIAHDRGFGDYLQYVDALNVATAEGALILAIRAAVR
jgi:hypothetical protein